MSIEFDRLVFTSTVQNRHNTTRASSHQHLQPLSLHQHGLRVPTRTATLGLLCYVVSHVLKGIYTTNGLLNRKCLNTPTELCSMLYTFIDIVTQNLKIVELYRVPVVPL